MQNSSECSLEDDTMRPPRPLSADEQEKLDKQKKTLSSFQLNKLEMEAARNWDIFYKRNECNFFKDRRWLEREFVPLTYLKESEGTRYFLEVGCGVGNAFFPLMEMMPVNVLGVAVDFSARAIEFVRTSEHFDQDRMRAFQCDVVKDDLKELVCGEVDVCTVIFVLSAIHPDKLGAAVRNLFNVMKPGGAVCVRDYAVNDHAMLRFSSSGHKIADRLYRRQDNTTSYFFYAQELRLLFENSGFVTHEAKYVESKTVNHKKALSVDRYFVQAVFRKPHL